MKLNVNKWKEFVIGDLFDVELSKGDLKIDDCETGDIPLVSSGQTNNGIIGHINKDGDGKAVMFSGGKITVDMFCSAFYQPDTFYSVSHGRVNILTPKFDYSEKILLFITTLINKEAFKYSYGRAVYSNEIQRMTISLPIEYESDDVTPKKDFSKGFHRDGYIPDFQWMEDYIKQLHSNHITTKNNNYHTKKLNVSDWKDFNLARTPEKSGLFDIESCKCSCAEDLEDGDEINYIGAKKNDNGIMKSVKMIPELVSKGNGILFICDERRFYRFYYYCNRV